MIPGNCGELVAHTTKTLSDSQHLEKISLRLLRKAYASAVDELELGFVAPVARVRDHHGEVVASLRFLCPAIRLRAWRGAEFGGCCATPPIESPPSRAASRRHALHSRGTKGGFP